MPNLKYFVFFDYHKIEEAQSAIEEFRTRLIDKFEKKLSINHLGEESGVQLVISELDLIEVLHQTKHEIERFSHLFLVSNPLLHFDDKSLIPDQFKKEHLKIPDDSQGYGLIGNVMTSNAYRQAASFVYWITKLKPILEVRVEDSSKFKPERIYFLQKYINEYFAVYVAFGIMRSAHKLGIESFSEITQTELDSFLHLLRYKNTSPESLAFFLEIWFKGVQRT